MDQARCWGFVLIGGFLAAAVAGVAVLGQAGGGRFKVVPLAELTREAPDLFKDKDFKDKDFKDKDFKERKLSPEEEARAFVAHLNRLGEMGWEAVSTGEKGVLFRRGKLGEKWEYRTLKAPDSTLNGKGRDDEVLTLVLEGLAANGWEPCLGPFGEGRLVFKRMLRREEGKSEEKKTDKKG